MVLAVCAEHNSAVLQALVFTCFIVKIRGLALTTVLPFAFAVSMPKIARCLCLRPGDQAVDACTVEGSGFASITASPSALAAFVSRSLAASSSANRFCIAATQTSVREAWYHWLAFVPDLQAVRVLHLIPAVQANCTREGRALASIKACCLPEQPLCLAARPPSAPANHSNVSGGDLQEVQITLAVPP